jgi:hypothetical protein
VFCAAHVPRLGPWADGNALFGLCYVLFFVAWVLLVARLGLVPATAMYFAQGLTLYSLLTLNPAAWYFGQSAVVAGGLIGLAALACWTATGGQRLFKEGFFGDD